MEYNFLDIGVESLDWNKINIADFNKNLANSIYMSTRDVGMITIAQEIYKGNPVILTDEQKEEIRNIVKQWFIWLVQKAINDLFDWNDNKAEQVSEATDFTWPEEIIL